MAMFLSPTLSPPPPGHQQLQCGQHFDPNEENCSSETWDATVANLATNPGGALIFFGFSFDVITAVRAASFRKCPHVPSLIPQPLFPITAYIALNPFRLLRS